LRWRLRPCFRSLVWRRGCGLEFRSLRRRRGLCRRWIVWPVRRRRLRTRSRLSARIIRGRPILIAILLTRVRRSRPFRRLRRLWRWPRLSTGVSCRWLIRIPLLLTCIRLIRPSRRLRRGLWRRP
jgi:hypothetical protein